jgi:hypothetical protein
MRSTGLILEPAAGRVDSVAGDGTVLATGAGRVDTILAWARRACPSGRNARAGLNWLRVAQRFTFAVLL